VDNCAVIPERPWQFQREADKAATVFRGGVQRDANGQFAAHFLELDF
jgi:hypothetical protein